MTTLKYKPVLHESCTLVVVCFVNPTLGTQGGNSWLARGYRDIRQGNKGASGRSRNDGYLVQEA